MASFYLQSYATATAYLEIEAETLEEAQVEAQAKIDQGFPYGDGVSLDIDWSGSTVELYDNETGEEVYL